MSVSAQVAAEMASLLTVPPWKRVLDRFMLALNVLSQAGLLVAFFAEVLRQSPDRASIALFFFTGFFLLHFGLWRRIGSADALRENLTPFLNVAQSIEDDALKDLYADGESPGQGLRRVRQLTPVLPKLIFMARWQAPLVSVVLTLLFEIGGRHIVPHWPNGQGRDLVEHCTVVLHISLIAYAGRVFLVTCAMQWMSSLCMDCCLRLLADRAARAPTWHQLAQTVRQHHNLLTGFNRIQKYFSEDLSLVVRLMLFLGLIGALRIAFGVQDINNMVIMGIVYSYVATICVAGELQEIAGDTFHSAVCSCPWEGWPVEDRRSYVMLVARTLRPPQVRFRYFGAMRLDTLSKIFNNLFKYVQVMRAGFSEDAWSE